MVTTGPYFCGSLEAEVTLYLSPELNTLLSKLENELRFVLICSKVTLVTSTDLPANAENTDVDLSNMDLIKEENMEKENRTDYKFKFEGNDNHSFTIGEAKRAIEFSVHGNHIGSINAWMKLPEKWIREYKEKTIYDNIHMFSFFFIIIITIIIGIRYLLQLIKDKNPNLKIIYFNLIKKRDFNNDFYNNLNKKILNFNERIEKKCLHSQIQIFDIQSISNHIGLEKSFQTAHACYICKHLRTQPKTS